MKVRVEGSDTLRFILDKNDIDDGGSSRVRTAEDYIFGCVNFAVPEEAVKHLLDERGIEPGTPLSDLDKKTRELLKADLYVWICMGPSKVSSTSDSDNGWSHSEGGYTLSDEDKDRMLKYAKAIYEKYDEEFEYDDSVSVAIESFGITPCDYDEAGIPLPHIVDYEEEQGR